MEKNTTALFPGSEVVYADRKCTIVADSRIHAVAYTERGSAVVWDERFGNYVAAVIAMNTSICAKVAKSSPSVAAIQMAA